MRGRTEISRHSMKSPAGVLTIIASDSALTHVIFGEVHPDGALQRKSPIIERTVTQFHEYFRGERRTFDLPIAPKGTPFQIRVLDALQRIKYGTLVSYGGLAMAVGNPRASQAVGQVVGGNPLGIIIPCHRVIRSDGELGGFAGGAHAKKALLKLEGFVLDDMNQVVRA